MEQAGNYVGATGFTRKGIQIFYPIHLRLMICFYDPKVYDFGNGCKNCFGTESIDEIHQLNALQLINSNSQIFFEDSISKEYVDQLYVHFKEFMGTAKKINEFIQQNHRKFLFTSSEDPHINLTLDFFSLKVNPKDFKDDFAPIRHPSLERLSTKKKISTI